MTTKALEVLLWLQTGLVLAVAVVLRVTSAECKFPRFMHTEQNAWVRGYEKGDRFVAYFQDGIMKASSCRANQCVLYERKCIEELPNGQYIASHSEQHHAPRFLCLEFVRRSEIIVQLKQSELSSNQYPSLCKKLVLDQWPLVLLEKLLDHKVGCPFSGGYNLQMFDSSGTPLCPQEIVPIRLESECESGEGMMIHFRKELCIHPDLNMEVKQKLYCLAHWAEGKYRFIILREKDRRDHIWSLRIKEPVSEIKDAALFMVPVCDAEDTITQTNMYLQLKLDKYVVSTTCADEFKDCSQYVQFCDSGYRQHCSNSCRDCRPDVINLCPFSERLRSTWVQSMKRNKQLSINITHYHIYIQSLGMFHCLMAKGKSTSGTNVLLQLFQNGCYPRYTCLQIEKTAPSVIRYRLGRSIEWPLAYPGDLKTFICKDDHFDYSPDVQAVQRKPMTVLVNLKKTHSVNCNLNPAINRFTRLRDEKFSEYCLLHDPSINSDRIVLHHLNSSSKPKQISFACLASFDINQQTKAVVLKAMHRKNHFVCWVFTARNKILVLPPSDCTNTTAHEQPITERKEDEASQFLVMKDVSRTCEEFCLTSTPHNNMVNTTLLPSSSSWYNSSGPNHVPAGQSSKSPASLGYDCRIHHRLLVVFILFLLISLVCMPA
ncbi:unnamed protein product [Acanthosepion pharaonis]|uniref:DUF7043 domain-containing protein n=1 Tax=Acanthosepion pharaonis TaxID=158019 RepID=A0A812EGM8_ACAPH|nr:unnamed protein product [Sepia pharaonis]